MILIYLEKNAEESILYIIFSLHDECLSKTIEFRFLCRFSRAFLSQTKSEFLDARI